MSQNNPLKDTWGHTITLYIVVGVRTNGSLWVHEWASGNTVVYRNKDEAEKYAKRTNEEKHNGISQCQAIPFKPECLQ